jgi:transposase-like protein
MYFYRAIDSNGNSVEFCLSERRKALQRHRRPERIVIDGSQANREAILCGIEMVHMMRKGQAKYACRSQLSLAEQFHLLAP